MCCVSGGSGSNAKISRITNINKHCCINDRVIRINGINCGIDHIDNINTIGCPDITNNMRGGVGGRVGGGDGGCRGYINVR